MGPFHPPAGLSAADQNVLQLVLMLVLLVLLLAKQVIGSQTSSEPQRTDAVISIVVIPLFFAFVAIAVSRSADVMGL